MKKEIRNWTKEDKERIILDIERMGIVVGCKKHSISKSQFYTWLERYKASGLAGLEDRRGKDLTSSVKRLEKENNMLKELLAEKELELKMKSELLKKKMEVWRRQGK